jgi:hypothetical protein
MLLEAQWNMVLEIDGRHNVSSQRQAGKLDYFVAPIGILLSSEPGGFGVSRRVFPAEELGGLSTFGDSLSGEMFFAGEAKGIS